MKTPLLTFFLLLTLNIFSQNIPFPNHTQYKGSYIQPSQYTQTQMDNQVTTFYDLWKSNYLINGCDTNHYYVDFASGNTNTVSEAHGYGMMIAPLMAGYDVNAKKYFDGMYRYYKDHPSSLTPYLMAWKQITGCIDSDGPDSATDGDIDVAFGLLLAHAQWGSNGTINYLEEAKLMIDDIMGATKYKGDINQQYNTIKLGDWVSSGSYMKGTRTSDFIMDHFRVFARATNDTIWYNVVNKCYGLINEMQTNYSSQTGLLPDFIVDVDYNAKPASADYLEGDHDGHYSYNACRDPWRMTNDYLTSGDQRPKDATVKIAKWLESSANGNVNNVWAGYRLNGSKYVSWTDNSFTAPFTVGAMLDTDNQVWLNTLYDEIKDFDSNGGYYDNTLTLLSMITISGNYWVPDTNEVVGIKKQIIKKDLFNIYNYQDDNLIKVKFNNMDFDSKYEIKIIDILGHTIWNNKCVKTETNIRTNSFNNGIYIVYISDSISGQIIESKKIAITK